jgi:hypothetical protein
MASKKAVKPQPVPMAHPSGTFIATKDVCAIWGCTIKTVYEKIDSGELPAYRFSDKPGAAIRVLVDDVYAALQPVIPAEVMADMRARQPAGSPLHLPVPATAVGDGL